MGLSEDRLRNTRAWAAARPDMSGSKVIVGAIDELLELRALLLASKRSHYECEDCWYSCPKSGECCNDSRRNSECDCGAAEWNAKVDAALASFASFA